MAAPTAIDVASWFINRIDRDAGDAITHLKVQKLVYFAQAWHLAHFGEPLFQEELKAWTHGPVAPSVWHKFKDNRWDALPVVNKTPEFPKKTTQLLEAVYASYGIYSAKQLESMTHLDLPWREARGDLPLEAKCDTPIRKETMMAFYKARLKNG